MKKSIVFNLDAKNHLEAKMFLDGGAPKIARYENLKYPQIDKFTERQMGFFWKPEEVDLTKDRIDFKNLPEEQKHIFESNLRRQILLDSVNQRGPAETLLPICSLPELESWLETWSANEAIHSRSYTHILRNVHPDPSKVFDGLTEIKEIVECARDVSYYYDNLHQWNIKKFAVEYGILPKAEYDEYEHKKALWLAIASINALEGIRFYVSFACSWAFGELKIMEGNAKIIKLICRDENLHLGFTQFLLKTLPKDDPDYEKIKNETLDEVKKMFNGVVNQEIEWANYLFKYGSMIGLSDKILKDYVLYIAAKRARSVNIPVEFEHPSSNPLPWTKYWIGGKEVQVAPQETEITSYLISDVARDVNVSDLSNMLDDDF